MKRSVNKNGWQKRTTGFKGYPQETPNPTAISRNTHLRLYIRSIKGRNTRVCPICNARLTDPGHSLACMQEDVPVDIHFNEYVASCTYPEDYVYERLHTVPHVSSRGMSKKALYGWYDMWEAHNKNWVSPQ